MFNRRVIAIIALSCCFFESIGITLQHFGITLQHWRIMDLEKNLRKPIYTYEQTVNGWTVEKLHYTSELSCILIFGEYKVFGESCLPIFFDNRFENFIKNVGKFSQSKLQEAIKDTILLSPYNYRAYPVRKLLNYLVEVLQNKILYIKDQINHNSKWDQKSFSSMKKSVAWAVGLTAFVIITNKYIGGNRIENQMSNLEFLNAVATLGLFPVSYQVLKNCYKFLTINPNAYNQYLDKYEELLAFVQKLKAQLEADGFITFKLTSGRIATVYASLSYWKRDTLLLS